MSIQPGTYRIKNVKSETYFDASVRDEGEIHGWASRPENENQKWIVEQSGNGYTLKNAGNGRYASVCEARDGIRVEATGNPYEWTIQNENGGYAIRAQNPAFVIDLDGGSRNDGTSVSIWGRNQGHDQQLWHFEQVGGGGYGGGQQGYGQQRSYQQQQGGYQGPVPPGAYHIINAFSGTVLDLAAGETAEGTPISGWERGNGPNQIWHLEPGQNGYRLKNHQAGTYAGFGDNVQEGALLTGTSKVVEWKLVQVGGDSVYQFQAASNENFVLDLAAGSKADGAKICIWENKTGQNQQWRLEPAQV